MKQGKAKIKLIAQQWRQVKEALKTKKSLHLIKIGEVSDKYRDLYDWGVKSVRNLVENRQVTSLYQLTGDDFASFDLSKTRQRKAPVQNISSINKK